MLGLELLKIIRLLSKVELAELQDFLYMKSSGNEENTRLFQACCTWVEKEKKPVITTALMEHSEIEDFLAQLGKVINKDDYKRYHYSAFQNKVLPVVASWVAYKGMSVDAVGSRQHECQWWIGKKQGDQALAAYKQLLLAIERRPLGPEYYRMKFEAQWLGLQLPKESLERDPFKEFENFGDTLDKMYWAFKFKFMYAELSYVLVKHVSIEIVRFQGFMDFLSRWDTIRLREEGGEYLVALYGLCCAYVKVLAERMSLKWKDQDLQLQALNWTKNSSFGKEDMYLTWSIQERVDYCSGWLNLYFDRILSGEDSFIREAFDLYRYMVRQKLLLNQNGDINIFHLKNLTKLGSFLREFEVVEVVLYNHAKLIPAHILNLLELLSTVDRLAASNVNEVILQLCDLRDKWKWTDEDLFFKLDVDVAVFKAYLWKAIHLPSEFKYMDEDKAAAHGEMIRKKINDNLQRFSPTFEIAYKELIKCMKFAFEHRQQWEPIENWKLFWIEKINAAPFCMERHWLLNCW